MFSSLPCVVFQIVLFMALIKPIVDVVQVHADSHGFSEYLAALVPTVI